MRTLVLGGYGNFGARIARALARDDAIELMIAGRDGTRAAAFAAQIGRGTQALPVDLASADLVQTLRDQRVELLIHAAGPFQQQDYRVAHAAAAAGANYIDLADGRRFVCDFESATGAAFRAAGRVGVSGASTVPALSSAVVEHLCQGWQRLDTIDTCIAPAQTAPRGLATLAGVLDYCGAPISVWDQGRWQSRAGWAKPVSVRFAKLRPRLGALCDIPDLELFVQRYAVTDRVMFRAALELGSTQRALATLARLRGWGVIKQPATLARWLHRAANALDFLGSALGGMVLRVEGLDAAGRALQRTWHITADDDHGPEIPCMAAILLARRLARPHRMTGGASACMGLLNLAEFEPEFARWGMSTQIDDVALAPTKHPIGVLA